MKVLLSWLRELCPVEHDADELAELLTHQGVHVEAVLRPWSGLRGVLAARVLEVRPHPGSDTLVVAAVDAGAGPREVVVGVRNMGPGDVVPYAPPGASVPALPEPLTARTIRGVTSQGMVCSPRELGVSADHSGILVLPADTRVGADVKAHLGLDDAVLDIEIEPNRPDLMSVIGVAREAAAATGAPLTQPDASVDEGEEKAADVATVDVLDLDRCPRYLARVIRGVGVGPSPLAVQARLTATGMRPVSNVVDATNYVMLEMGQPMHPFDLALLEGRGIVVRRAGDGERLVTLDDVERVLTTEDLVIADHARAVAVAGVMGSAAAEVSPSTVDVLLESACFSRAGVLRTARRIGLATEASMRFERGADPEAVAPAADRAAALIAAWSGGTVAAGAVDVGGVPERRRVRLRPARASLLAGFDVTGDDAHEVFARLGMRSVDAGDTIEVEVPGYRVDLEREVDLVEEVARIRGYDRVGSELPGVRQSGGEAPGYTHRRRIRAAMVRAGLRETTSLSFATTADLDLMGDAEAVRVANPLTAEQEFLRTSLVPGLVGAVGRNLARQVRRVALFEVGRVFSPGPDADAPSVVERDRVAFALTGEDVVALAGVGEEPAFVRLPLDVAAAKGVLEALMRTLGIEDWSVGDPPGRPFHPARSAEVLVDGQVAGAVGELDPRVARALDLPARVALGEVDAGILAARATREVSYRDPSRFPPVHRDLAFVVDEPVPAGAVRTILVEAAAALLESCELFDVYRGAGIPAGRKSLAFSLDFRADRTLTDEEVDATVASAVQRVAAEVGGELRGG